jgi:hypothetical protein
MLSLLGATLGVVYITLAVTAVVTTPANATLRALTRAVHLWWAAVLVASVEAVVYAAQSPHHIALMSALWLATFGFGCGTLRTTVRRRNAKGEQVVADAERTVRDWQAGL